ncbi:2-aminoethylphosphonate--pyruvate transaminase [Paenibacillus qinlingensis]|uniref:2-aminoethylphosphonate--pyruvate transaminase n=1 Tax=Paenibacillus qinlingensis TaxID=1837343 RepID=UPI0015654DC2|nr:2-aminoethylphosphonate--pyruvate transaminase [Paenibacillus qinlingensis]NQX63633.1 2-aminoethylphosphonate--pyruvate transaminase [Paenibacillus qinlingensis]
MNRKLNVNVNQLPDNPYLLLTPGPLSTSKKVKAAMLRDWCTWDQDYNQLVQSIRGRLVQMATSHPEAYTSILMQGSGTFCVESVIGSVIPPSGKLLVLTNGAYGKRIAQMAEVLGIYTIVVDAGETKPVNVKQLEDMLKEDTSVTHLAVVHVETTTGMINPIADVAKVSKQYGKTLIVDAMSSFGGVPIDVAELDIDFLISSANKCIQGVPGFGIIIAKKETLYTCKGLARSLSLDLYDQWETMELSNGKWRYTSPTHTVRAFDQALQELEEEGGVTRRFERFTRNQQTLVEGMHKLGFQTLLPEELQSPIITAFLFPDSPVFSFEEFYVRMKEEGFVIYPGKITTAPTFRIGNIGDVHLEDIHRLLQGVENQLFWRTT